MTQQASNKYPGYLYPEWWWWIFLPVLGPFILCFVFVAWAECIYCALLGFFLVRSFRAPIPADRPGVLRRYAINAFLGAALGVCICFSLGRFQANDFSWNIDWSPSGLHVYREEQDALIERARQLIVCRKLVTDGFDFAMRGAALNVFVLFCTIKAREKLPGLIRR